MKHVLQLINYTTQIQIYQNIHKKQAYFKVENRHWLPWQNDQVLDNPDSMLVDLNKHLGEVDQHRIFVTHTGCRRCHHQSLWAGYDWRFIFHPLNNNSLPGCLAAMVPYPTRARQLARTLICDACTIAIT